MKKLIGLFILALIVNIAVSCSMNAAAEKPAYIPPSPTATEQSAFSSPDSSAVPSAVAIPSVALTSPSASASVKADLTPSPKASVSSKASDKKTSQEKPDKTKEPASTEKPKTSNKDNEPSQTAALTPAPTAAPTPKPEPKPEKPAIKELGSGFNNEVLAGVNSEREYQGVPSVSLDGGKCAKALAHARAMAEAGKVFHAGLGYEAVTDSTSSGSSIGKRCANHAGDLAVNPDIKTIGVGSVKVGDKQYTCVYG